jgi:hypothetical protein
MKDSGHLEAKFQRIDGWPTTTMLCGTSKEIPILSLTEAVFESFQIT